MAVYSKWRYASRWLATNELCDFDDTGLLADKQEANDFNSGDEVEILFSSWGYITWSSPISLTVFEVGTLRATNIFPSISGDRGT